MIYSQRDEKECNFDPDLRWTVVLWDRVCRGGLGGRSPPSLDLHWILKTRSFLGSDVALDRDITWFCGPGRVSGGRGGLFFLFAHAYTEECARGRGR